LQIKSEKTGKIGKTRKWVLYIGIMGVWSFECLGISQFNLTTSAPLSQTKKLDQSKVGKVQKARKGHEK
jgi:hypothetical protein